MHGRPGVVTELADCFFTVELVGATVTMKLPYREYRGVLCAPRGGCGHSSHSLACYLAAGHAGPHLYKPVPAPEGA
jgi:hypothetical protein